MTVLIGDKDMLGRVEKNVKIVVGTQFFSFQWEDSMLQQRNITLDKIDWPVKKVCFQGSFFRAASSSP